MTGRNRIFCCVSAFALATVLGTTSALAQDATGETAAAAQPTDAVEPQAAADAKPDEAAPENTGEIVVTAQKRAENVQDVPISIAAFSGETLERNNVTTVEDLGKITPNFSVAKGAQTAYIRMNVRGIGAASNTTVEPSVAVFLDGSYVPHAGAVISSMLDMESVEVLRGPQGTLFGRNASVGAVSFHTARPKFGDTYGEVTGEVGTGDRYKVSGVVNLPVAENMAFRITGSQQWFDGYWNNEFDSKQVGGTDESIIRGSFRGEWGPVEWLVRADYSKISGDGATNIDFDRNSVSDGQWLAFSGFLGAPDTDLGDRTMNQYLTADVDDKQWGLNSTLTWDIGGGSTVRLINAYRDWSNEQLDGDVVFTPTPIASRTGLFDSKAQNHELQFISPKDQWLGGRLDLVAGLYYFQEDYSQGERLHMNSQFCAKLAGNHPACNAILASTGGRNATIQDIDQDSTSFAAYTQANFHITDKVFATVGGRYTDDSKEGRYDQSTNLFLAGVRADEHLDLPDIDDHRFTYRLGLNYEPTEDHLLFASYSTGYKSAGYNSGAGSPSLTTLPPLAPGQPPRFVPERRVFDRETVENWELGAKTSWLDHTLNLNLTLYRMDISGFQDRSYDGTSFTVRNAGNLRHQGFEFDAVARALPGLSLFASVAYLDSEFTKYPDAAGLPGCAPVGGVIAPICLANGLGRTQDLKGTPATFAPKWSGRLGFDYAGDVGSSGLTWGVNSNLSFTSKFFGGLVNDANPQTIVDGYALLGARLVLNGRNDRWSIAVFGNNLTNKQYEAGNLYQFLESSLPVRNVVFPGSTAVRRLHADPRTLGAAATFRF